MKKIITLISMLFLIFSLCIPTYATPVEKNDFQCDHIPANHKERLLIAANVFPEFAGEILGNEESLSVATILDADYIVYSETRELSETTMGTYQRNASGLSSLIFVENLWMNSSSTGTGYSQRNVTISVDCLVSDDFMYIEGLAYTLVQGGYDCIQSRGNTSFSTCQMNNAFNYYKPNEDANGAACVRYQGLFSPKEGSLAQQPYAAVLYVYVGNDQMTHAVYG